MSTAYTSSSSSSIDYGHVQKIRINLDDLDGLGIVHNARYAILFERVLIDYWLDRGWHFDAKRSVLPDILQVVGEFHIRFRVPIMSIGHVSVHFWLERVDGPRATYEFRFLSPDGGTVYAEGHRVQVNIDPATLKPAPFSDKALDMSRVLMRAPGSAPPEAGPPTTEC
ncbi:acyl-CoA thioesterase [Streptomyces nigra]|uniref:acyl-CoA thioesterase n=1 Tax=Streptomyces nigra TaxID=1827580 RepID=UPI003646BF1E